MIEDLPGRYHEYLARFVAEVGELPVGAFAKFGGRLIKKLAFEEFTPAFLDFTEVLVRYSSAATRSMISCCGSCATRRRTSCCRLHDRHRTRPPKAVGMRRRRAWSGLAPGRLCEW